MPKYPKGFSPSLNWLKDHVAHDSDRCLRWPFGYDTKGYGSIKHDGRIQRAHRVMLCLAAGDPPSPEHQASHECGNGHLGCVNPKHLKWKTPAENQLDRAKHGTAATSRGSACRRTPEETETIRRAIGTDTVTNLAERFKVSRRTIERLRDGHVPRHLSQDPKNARRRIA